MPTALRSSALPPLLLVLVPLSLLQTLWGLLPLPGADPALVINGVLVVPPAGPVEALVVGTVWTWAVTAAVAAMAGLDRPLRRALRVLPTVCAALLAATATVLVALLLLGFVLVPAANTIWVGVALFALPVGLLLVRLALVLPIALFEDGRGRAAFRTASQSARGRAVSLGILLLLGVAAPAQLLGWAFAHPEEHVSNHVQGLLAWLMRDVALVFVAALQASTLLVAYRNLPGRLMVPPPMPGPGPGRLPPQGDRESRTRSFGRLARPLGIVAVLLPTVVAGGVVGAKRLPEVTVQRADPHQMIAVGWPAGRDPILVRQQAIEDCVDDRCRTVRRTELSVLMYEPYGGAAFGPDGSVFALGQHELEQCDAQRICRRREGGLPALSGSGAAAIALSPAGEILIASATENQPPGPADGAAPEEAHHVELKLIRCADVFCEDPAVTSFGLVDGSLRQPVGNSRPAKLMVRTDGRGRPVVAFRSPFSGRVSIGWCMTRDCDRADVASFRGPRTSAMPTDEELALLDFDGMLDCLGEDDCGGGEAVATAHGPHGAVYEVVIEHGYPNGFHVQVGGSATPPGRAVLRICTARACGDPKRIPLVPVPPVYAHWTDRPAHERWLIAVAPDGAMVATDEFANQTVVVRP